MTQVNVSEVVSSAVSSVVPSKGKRGRKAKKTTGENSGTNKDVKKPYLPPSGSKWSGVITVPPDHVMPPISSFDLPSDFYRSQVAYFQQRYVDVAKANLARFDGLTAEAQRDLLAADNAAKQGEKAETNFVSAKLAAVSSEADIDKLMAEMRQKMLAEFLAKKEAADKAKE